MVHKSIYIHTGHAAWSCSLVMQPDHGVSSHKLMHDTRGLCMIIKSLPVLVAMCVCACVCTGSVLGSLRWTYTDMVDLIAALCTVTGSFCHSSSWSALCCVHARNLELFDDLCLLSVFCSSRSTM